ncbi:hypothetical protein LUZ60_009067 [Juncus effusus]|nr:hypothetical protein LUZ60_009067 [Juncus effusus]
MDPVSVSVMMSMIGWMASAIVSRLLTGSVEGWAKIAYLSEEVDSLKKKLQEITILLDNAQRSNLTNWPLLQSVCDLQQAVYDAEDLLEELDYYRLQDTVEERQDYRKNVSGKKPCKPTILFRDVVSVVTKKGSCSSARSVSVQEPEPQVPKLDKLDFSKRLNDVVKKLDQNGEVVSKALSLENLGRIAESLSLENLHKIAENLFRRNIKASETSGNTTVKQISRNMLGIELRKEEMVEIVNRLTNNDSGVENIWVLPIFGHGGVGKTTLAKFVFDDEKVKKHFDERMWLRVSRNLDVKSLTLEMIGLSNGEQEIGINGNVEELHDTIKNKLESKKVLLVVDNLCPEDMTDERWAWLKELFSGTASKGTKILVTTRNLLFAENIKTGGPIIRLDGLKGKELEALFDACAYWGNDPKKYSVLHGLRLSLINKLHGYPLEVKQIGAVLRSKLDFEHWNMVLNSDEWKKPKKKDESKDIMSSLEISYRYLKLDQFFNHSSDKEENVSNNRKFPKLLFRLYHLETLDISDWSDDFNLPQLTHRLVSLRRFYARGEQLAMISEVGRLQFLEELREFTVQSKPGFDIMQLGKLKNLGGSIRIFNLENIISKEDATKANLVGKTELRDLSLHWSSDRMYAQPDGDLSILENLKPPPSIRNLDIHEYTDSKFPHWMVRFHSPSYLRSLNLINCFNLEDLPPLGQLEVLEQLQFKGMHKIKEVTKEFYGDCAKGPFKSLKEMLFSDMRNWKKWAGTEKYTVFPSLKKLEIINCPVLSELPQQPCGTKIMHWFPCLIEFKVESCQNLVLPPLPHTENLAKINVRNGSDQLKNLVLLSPELSLSIEWSKQSRTFNREVLVFSKLSKLTELSIKGCPIARLPWKGFKELASLKRLIIEDLEENTPSKEKWVLPESLELLEIASNHVTGQQLSEWLLCLPNLLTLVVKLSGITCLNVEDESTTSTNNSQLGDSYSSIQILPHKLQSLKEIIIDGCKNLVSLRPQSGLRGFTSLEKLTIKNCSGLLHPLVGSSDIPIFPPSLLKLEIDYLPENLLSKLISNPSRLEHMKLGYSPKLVSLSMRPFGALQYLNIETCRALHSLQDVDSLSSLIQLDISKCPKLSADWEAASQRKESVNENFTLPINVLTIDDTSFLSEKMYGYLPTLEKLVFDGVQTKELNEGLSLVNLTSLKEINFLNCPNLQYLPNELSDLTHLSTLIIRKCPEIKLLPDLHHLHELYIDQSNNQLEAWCRKHCKVTKLHAS